MRYYDSGYPRIAINPISMNLHMFPLAQTIVGTSVKLASEEETVCILIVLDAFVDAFVEVVGSRMVLVGACLLIQFPIC
jgi:hypothetical protein